MPKLFNTVCRRDRWCSRKAKAIAEERRGYLANQFNNPDNADAHRKTTAVEILRDTYGLFDGFVAGVGTGGTLCGTASVLKGYNPDVKMLPLTDGISRIKRLSRRCSRNCRYRCEFHPRNYDASVVDEVLDVSTEQAVNAARLVAQTEGLLVGISSGAALYAAAQILRRPLMHGKRLASYTSILVKISVRRPLWNKKHDRESGRILIDSYIFTSSTFDIGIERNISAE